jgi:hypothetical protein
MGRPSEWGYLRARRLELEPLNRSRKDCLEGIWQCGALCILRIWIAKTETIGGQFHRSAKLRTNGRA